MNCLFCPATFETKSIETGFTDPKKREAAEAALAAQTAEGEAWENVQVTVTRNGARVEVLAGNTCPAHALKAGVAKLSAE